MVDVQEYIQEIEYTRQNQAVIEKEKAEAKKIQEKNQGDDVPEGFGKPQANADQFQTVSFTVKPKKRTHQQMMAAQPQQEVPTAAGPSSDKRPKMDVAPSKTTTNETEVQNKENSANGSVSKAQWWK